MTSSKTELPPIPEPLPVPAVDAHTHLDACGAVTAVDVAAIVNRAEQAGIARVITVADDLASARWVAKASTWDSRVYAAVAIHPTRANTFDADVRSEVERLSSEDRVVAIGETGLDYYWPQFDENTATPAEQQDAFRWHIALAKRLSKALMIHDRDAHEDILRILEEEGAPERVVFHCFSGDGDFARRCVDAGYVLSFAGPVTFKNSHGLRDAAKLVPSDQFLVETDAPFLTPHPFRGRPNEPYCVAYTIRFLAELRGESVEQVASSVWHTADRVFRFG